MVQIMTQTANANSRCRTIIWGWLDCFILQDLQHKGILAIWKGRICGSKGSTEGTRMNIQNIINISDEGPMELQLN